MRIVALGRRSLCDFSVKCANGASVEIQPTSRSPSTGVDQKRTRREPRLFHGEEPNDDCSVQRRPRSVRSRRERGVL